MYTLVLLSFVAQCKIFRPQLQILEFLINTISIGQILVGSERQRRKSQEIVEEFYIRILADTLNSPTLVSYILDPGFT